MHMTRTGGMKEWFKGNGVNCVRIVPNSAIKFVTYEQLSRCAAAHAPSSIPCSKCPCHYEGSAGQPAAVPHEVKHAAGRHSDTGACLVGTCNRF